MLLRLFRVLKFKSVVLLVVNMDTCAKYFQKNLEDREDKLWCERE